MDITNIITIPLDVAVYTSSRHKSSGDATITAQVGVLSLIHWTHVIICLYVTCTTPICVRCRSELPPYVKMYLYEM